MKIALAESSLADLGRRRAIRLLSGRTQVLPPGPGTPADLRPVPSALITLSRPSGYETNKMCRPSGNHVGSTAPGPCLLQRLQPRAVRAGGVEDQLLGRSARIEVAVEHELRAVLRPARKVSVAVLEVRHLPQAGAVRRDREDLGVRARLLLEGKAPVRPFEGRERARGETESDRDEGEAQPQTERRSSGRDT